MTSFCKKFIIIFLSPPVCARELKLRQFDSESKSTSGCSNSVISKKKSPLKVCFHSHYWIYENHTPESCFVGQFVIINLKSFRYEIMRINVEDYFRLEILARIKMTNFGPIVHASPSSLKCKFEKLQIFQTLLISKIILRVTAVKAVKHLNTIAEGNAFCSIFDGRKTVAVTKTVRLRKIKEINVRI